MTRATKLALVLVFGLSSLALAAKHAQQAASEAEARRVTAENSVRNADDGAVSALRTRLSWKPWDEVR